MKKISKLLLPVLLFSFFIVLTACKSGTPGSIEFWTVFTGPDGQSMQAIVDAYNKTNPAVKIKHRPILAEDLYTKIPTMVKSGKNVPALCINHVERLPLYAENGLLAPIDGYLSQRNDIKAENYVDVAWKMSDINGKHYAVPLDVHSFPMYYNADLIKKYGLESIVSDRIVTFDEVRKAHAAITDADVKTIGVTWMRVLFLAWYAQLGGKISEDGTNPSLNNDIAFKVLDNYRKMREDGITTQDGDDPIQLFKSGKLLFLPEGIWMKNSLEEIQGLNWEMTHVVSFDTKNVFNWTSSHQIVMLKDDKRSQAEIDGALNFLAWLADNSLEWAKAGQNPASLKILDNEEFRNMKHGFLLKEPQTLKIYDYKYYGYLVEALDKMVGDAVFGKIDVRDGLAKAQTEVEDKIKNASH